MNSDIRVSVSFKGHHKRKRLNAILGYDATGQLLDLWISAATSRPNGVLYGWDETDIALAAGAELSRVGSVGTESVPTRGSLDTEVGFVSALLSVGFLDREEGGTFVLHDWIEHNPWASSADDRSQVGTFSNLKKYYPDAAKELEKQGITQITREEYAEVVNKIKQQQKTGIGTDSVLTSDTDRKPTPPYPYPLPSPPPSENPTPRKRISRI